MNIKGVVRQLPLFQPPIDPALLVRAAAAGLDLSSVLNDLYAPSPHYRFQVMLQKATELCAEVKSLGASLLSALEKKDAEELAMLRNGHETKLLEVIKVVKEKHKEETVQSRESLDKTSQIVSQRNKYYSNLKKKGLNRNEERNLSKLRAAQDWQSIGRMAEVGAGVAYAVPQKSFGSSPPRTSTSYGGLHAGKVLEAAGRFLGLMADIKSYQANRNQIQGSNLRRADEWQQQIDITNTEKEQVGKQIAAAEIRQAIAEKYLNNHIVQIENSKAVETYLRNKFTNKQLYNWMVSQISSVYFQSYQLAYDIAKQTEKAYRYELGLDDSNFIQFGYWDSLKKGLLSGEKLYHDLKRMEMAYLENNKREYELTKHISLALLDPIALLKLRETGECYISIPEALFDLDHPGHYMRRIKTISLTIPCVTGPYTNVSATLTLQSNRIRKKTTMSTKNSEYQWDGNFEDDRFNYNLGGIQSIATSSGQNDSGLFELNFRDERYLPFEGAGAISTWHIQLPKKFRQFDYNTISDVVMHMRYTAREGGDTLKNRVEETLQNALEEMPLGENGQERTGLFQVFSAKQEFPSQWHRFLHPTGEENPQDLKLDLIQKRFPLQFKDRDIKITTMDVFLQLKEGIEYSDESPLLVFSFKNPNEEKLYPSPSSETPPGFKINKSMGLPFIQPFTESEETLGTWTIKVEVSGDYKIPKYLKKDDSSRLNPDAIEDLFIVCHYTISK